MSKLEKDPSFASRKKIELCVMRVGQAILGVGVGFALFHLLQI